MHEAKTPSIIKAAEIIKHLQLTPHPEGGWFREVYRSKESISAESLPERYTEKHNFSTSIYFLLEANDFSAFHRIKSDETWHFYAGSTVKLYIINEGGFLIEVLLGNNYANGELFQYTITANCWFAAEIDNQSDFALVGCTVAPGFDFTDFELAGRESLCHVFPHHQALIENFTRQ